MPEPLNRCGCMDALDCCECGFIALQSYVVGSVEHRVHRWCLPSGHPDYLEYGKPKPKPPPKGTGEKP